MLSFCFDSKSPRTHPWHIRLENAGVPALEDSSRFYTNAGWGSPRWQIRKMRARSLERLPRNEKYSSTATLRRALCDVMNPR